MSSCYPYAMAADVLPSPLDRIDRALARLEAAVSALPTASVAADPGLVERHAALKAAMAEAIVSLDAVLAKGSA